jgi:hypothetical protein
VVSRRLELLKLEGLGFSQAEIVKELSQECECFWKDIIMSSCSTYIQEAYRGITK